MLVMVHGLVPLLPAFLYRSESLHTNAALFFAAVVPVSIRSIKAPTPTPLGHQNANGVIESKLIFKQPLLLACTALGGLTVLLNRFTLNVDLESCTLDLNLMFKKLFVSVCTALFYLTVVGTDLNKHINLHLNTC
jgi:hypothetical protein